MRTPARTFSLAPQRKRYPTAVVDGLRGRGVTRNGIHLVACVRCAAEVPEGEWPFHGSLDSNRCISPWERQVAARKRAA